MLFRSVLKIKCTNEVIDDLDFSDLDARLILVRRINRSVIFHLGDLEIITIPGELFSTFGIEIKKHFHAPMRIVWGYANYSAGYIVEKDEFGKGYESMQTPFLQGEAELYVDHLIKSL